MKEKMLEERLLQKKMDKEKMMIQKKVSNTMIMTGGGGKSVGAMAKTMMWNPSFGGKDDDDYSRYWAGGYAGKGSGGWMGKGVMQGVRKGSRSWLGKGWGHEHGVHPYWRWDTWAGSKGGGH